MKVFCPNCGKRDDMLHGNIWGAIKKFRSFPNRNGPPVHYTYNDRYYCGYSRGLLKRHTARIDRVNEWGFGKWYHGFWCPSCAAQHREDKHYRKLKKGPIYVLPIKTNG